MNVYSKGNFVLLFLWNASEPEVVVTSRSLSYSQCRTTTDWLTEETENFDKLSRKAALKFIKVSLRDARACLKRAGRVADVDGLLVVDGVGVRCPAEGRRRLARCGSVAAPQEDAAQSRWL